MKNLLFKLLPVIIILLPVATITAQNKTEQNNLQEAIKLCDKAQTAFNSELLQKAKEIFQKNNSGAASLYYQTLCEYKLLEVSARPGSGNLFEENYESGIANAEKLSSKKGYESEGRTLLAALYMMKIASNQMSAVTLMPKIFSLLDEAQNIDPDNPRSYLIRGIMKFQTPEMFGGSSEEAVKNFSKAILLFEDNDETDLTKPHWGYLEALTWMGQSQEKLGHLETAEFFYQKVLNVEPEYAWVKHSLLPNLLEKLEK